jgi:hypothetical protein
LNQSPEELGLTRSVLGLRSLPYCITCEREVTVEEIVGRCHRDHHFSDEDSELRLALRTVLDYQSVHILVHAS